MQDLIRKDRQCGHGPAHTTHSRLFEISSFKSNSIYAFYWVFYSIFGIEVLDIKLTVTILI